MIDKRVEKRRLTVQALFILGGLFFLFLSAFLLFKPLGYFILSIELFFTGWCFHKAFQQLDEEKKKGEKPKDSYN